MPHPIKEGRFADLISRACNGDELAKWELVDSYAPKIYHVVRARLGPKLREKYDSGDFVQDVWVSFFAHPELLQDIETPEQLIGLLRAMGQHKVLDEIRKRFGSIKYDVKREVSDGVDVALANHPTVEQVAIARECFANLIEGESRKTAEIARLRTQGETQANIAEQLDISDKTVRRKIAKLREKLLALDEQHATDQC